MWASVPELTPREVGTPLPISVQVAPETYTYDYIIVGGTKTLHSLHVLQKLIDHAQAELRAAY